MKDEIQLGDQVKCKYTGFKGIAVCKMEFINKCVQFGVAPKANKDNKVPEEIFIDSQSLIIVKKAKREEPEDEFIEDDEPTGGPSRPGIKMRGF